MNRFKEIIEFIKEKLQNKRTRAITILSLYFMFFAFLFLLIGINPNRDINDKESISNATINNKYINLSFDYSYKYTIELQTKKEVNKYIISGKYINNETNYVINKLIDNEYVEINDFDLINEDMLYIENILKYIENKDYEYQTKYKNGVLLENYKIPINEINNEYVDNKDIEINIESKDNFITKIFFYSSELDNYLNKNVTLAKYVLEYEKDEN